VVASIVISDVRRSVNDLAETLGMSPRALSRYCLQRNLPRPVALLGWARAVHIVGALEGNDCSLEEIARHSGESSARDCAEYVRYHTGAGPTVWLRRGGINALIDALSHRLAARAEIPDIGGRNSVTHRLNFVYQEVGLAQ
jgi:methylphosphotriester-DNA--protein-cysteine methyltransferase